MGLADARDIVNHAIAAHVFPAAAAAVGSSREQLWCEAFGGLTFESAAPAASPETPFDLASLTKVIATTSLIMKLMQRGAISLDQPISQAFARWRGADRERATIRDLLEHASGLPARFVSVDPEGREAFEREICRVPLEYPPRERSVYSDLDFVLLGFLVADRGGAPMVTQFADLIGGVLPGPNSETLTFDLTSEMRAIAAPTLALPDDHRRTGRLAGQVQDNYAAALGGVAGHAGLFGTIGGVSRFAAVVLRAARGSSGPSPFSPDAIALFTARSSVPGSSRALGWDRMLPTSSCGRKMSAAAFGHTGYTGTSLWIDPERDRYFVLLTNRACGGGTLEEMKTVRRAFHDALGDF